MHGLAEAQLSWWQLLVLALGLVLAGELGFWHGRRQRGESVAERKAQAGVHVAALLALLGLMLAFSFGIVEARFSARKELIVDEANAIGTTSLRAETLPSPHRERMRALLQRYVSVHLRWSDAEHLEDALAASSELQAALWKEAVAVATENPSSLPVSNFEEALNSMFDLRESRVTIALHQRLPPAILMMLYAIAILALGVLGRSEGLGRSRSLMSRIALVLAITAVVTLIVDLDDPSSSMFQISQSAMSDLQQMMSRSYH